MTHEQAADALHRIAVITKAAIPRTQVPGWDDLMQSEEVAQLRREAIQQEIRERGLRPAAAKRREEVVCTDNAAASKSATIAQLNRDALSAVQAETQLTLREQGYSEWRPTVRTGGTINALPQRVECVATNGLLAIFVSNGLGGLPKAFIGHAAWFQWVDDKGEHRVGCPPTLHRKQSASSDKPKTFKPRRKSKSALWDEMLATI